MSRAAKNCDFCPLCRGSRGRSKMSHRINIDIWWVFWWFEKQVRFKSSMRPRDLFRAHWGSMGGRRGPRGLRGASRGSHGAIGLVWWVFRWFIRHICLYICDPNFSCGRTNGRTDGRTEVFHEALAALVMFNYVFVGCKGHQMVKKQSKRTQHRKISLLLFFGTPCMIIFKEA